MKVENSPIFKIWCLEIVEDTKLPQNVKEDLYNLYNRLGYGSNSYVYKYSEYEREYFEENYPNIIQWLYNNGIPKNEDFIIHWK